MHPYPDQTLRRPHARGVFAALPARPAPVFWHARTGRFRRLLRDLNPLSPVGWTVVALAVFAGAFWTMAIALGHAVVVHGLRGAVH